MWVMLLGKAGQSPESQSIEFKCGDPQSQARDVELRAMTSFSSTCLLLLAEGWSRIVIDLLDDFLQSQWRHISLSVV